MRRVSELPGTFDAFVNLWQSFGYFDEEANVDILRQIRGKLAPWGRLILDVYHKRFFERHQGVHRFEKCDVSVTEQKIMVGNRLRVTLAYDDRRETDEFDWRVYSPDELSEELEAVGFRRLTACTDFDERKPAASERPRMQLVFEKIG